MASSWKRKKEFHKQELTGCPLKKTEKKMDLIGRKIFTKILFKDLNVRRCVKDGIAPLPTTRKHSVLSDGRTNNGFMSRWWIGVEPCGAHLKLLAQHDLLCFNTIISVWFHYRATTFWKCVNTVPNNTLCFDLCKHCLVKIFGFFCRILSMVASWVNVFVQPEGRFGRSFLIM